MAIDKNATINLVQDIDTLYEEIAGKWLSKDQREMFKRAVLGPALEEVRHMITDSRPPRIYLIGRSGEGKSSLINALVGRHEAMVSDVKRGQTTSERYYVSFPKSYSSWDIYDSRGIFDPDVIVGQAEEESLEFLKRDLIEKKPDIILHVIAARSIRNLSCDIKALKEVSSHLMSHGQVMPKTLVVISQPDLLGDRAVWPPDACVTKAGLILEAMDYLCAVLKVKSVAPLNLNSRLDGYRVNDEAYAGIIPACLFMDLAKNRDDRWNVDTLSDFIGEELPEAAKLDFAQAQKRKELLMKMSASVIKRFASIATGIGGVPVPVPDIVILTPLQLLMVSIIAGLSCRPLSSDTAKEYLAAAGVNVGAAFALREGARQLVKLIPIKGAVISAGIAGASTYGIGKAAEAYFFLDKRVDPKDAAGQWKA